MLANRLTKIYNGIWNIVKMLWKATHQCYCWYASDYATKEGMSKHTGDYSFSFSRLTAVSISLPQIDCVCTKDSGFSEKKPTKLSGEHEQVTIADLTHRIQEKNK